MNNIELKPFENCPALDGYHCVTGSLAKIYHYYGHPLSEDMLLGLGAGMGFIYWKMKMQDETYIFIGGRANNQGFFTDLGNRTGVKIKGISTNSTKKAEAALLEKLKESQPVMLFADMGLLPWFEFPVEYHFGGHTFVVCGFDGKDTLLAADMDQKAAGLKQGFYAPITLQQLAIARNSKYKPFPPNNQYLEFNFSAFHPPEPTGIYSAIAQSVDMQLNPPIKNFGVKGIRNTASELRQWPELFGDHELRMSLFNLYIFIEIGGTGGGCFRYMYSRFLKESAEITQNRGLLDVSFNIYRSGQLFSEVASLFVDSETAPDLQDRIRCASDLFTQIAGIEERAYTDLSNCLP